MAQEILTKRALAEGLKTHLRQVDFSEITVEDICTAAEVSRRSFYRHFQDKYQLLNWLYDYEFCSVIRPKERDDLCIWDYFPAICRHLWSDRQFYLHAFSVYGQNSFREFCTGRLYPLLMHDLGGVFPNEATSHFVIDRLTNACFDGFQRWLAQEPCLPPDEYAANTEKLWTDVAAGLAALGAQKREFIHTDK